MAVLAGGAALGESVTVDEVSHIGAGVSYLERLDLRMNPEHPPLAKVLAAIPLVIRGVRAVADAVAYAGARMRRIRPCQAARRCVGRAALPQPVRKHPGVSCFRPPGAHGCGIDAVLAACAVDVFEPMA